MTLLLAAKCKSGIVLMADGLCRRLNPDGTRPVVRTDYQKLFPFCDRPIVVAHHGLNELSGRPVAEYIRHIDMEVKHVRTVAGIINHFEESLDKVVLVKSAEKGARRGEL